MLHAAVGDDRVPPDHRHLNSLQGRRQLDRRRRSPSPLILTGHHHHPTPHILTEPRAMGRPGLVMAQSPNIEDTVRVDEFVFTMSTSAEKTVMVVTAEAEAVAAEAWAVGESDDDCADAFDLGASIFSLIFPDAQSEPIDEQRSQPSVPWAAAAAKAREKAAFSKECGGGGICEHRRQRRRCKECGGASICEHGRERRRCKECGGASFCEHGRERSRCKECGGSGICEHGRRPQPVQGVRRQRLLRAWACVLQVLGVQCW